MHWDLIWATWLAVTLISFGIIETIALAQHRLDRTLSRRLRAWLGISPHRPWIILGISIFLGFFAWFIPHIVAGWGA